MYTHRCHLFQLGLRRKQKIQTVLSLAGLDMHEGHKMSGDALPLRIDLTHGEDPSVSLIITVVKPLPRFHVEKLRPEMFVNRNSVILSPVTLESLGIEYPFYYIRIQTKQSDPLRHGYLIRYGSVPSAFEVLESIGKFPAEADHELGPEHTTLSFTSGPCSSENMVDWQVNSADAFTSSRDTKPFSMKPPTSANPIAVEMPAAPKYTLSPQNEKTPLEFILSRYFNTLYSLTTPLSYFPKTALSRLRIMCDNDKTKIKETLLHLHLPMHLLNERQRSKYNLSKRGDASRFNSSIVSQVEAEVQELFVSKNMLDSISNELFEKLVLDLKVREAQLQVLVLMELLVCMDIDETKFITKGDVERENSFNKRPRPSLVRKRKTKVVTTFLGVGVPDTDSKENTNESTMSNKSLELNIYSSLTTLIDQIGLWDTLLEQGKSDKEGNTYGFLAYVLVPYYSKSLPQIVQLTIQNVKSLRPDIMKTKSSRSRISRSLSEAGDSESNTPETDSSKEPDSTPSLIDFPSMTNSIKSDLHDNTYPSKRSKFSKTLIDPSKIPFLNRGSASFDRNERIPPLSLKRSKSSLDSKNLKKRQVDMSIFKNDSQTDNLVKQNSFIFADARRTKSALNKSESYTSNVRQVEATPLKPSLSTVTRAIPQVFETPSNSRTVDMSFLIKETPQQDSKLLQPISLNERMNQVADNDHGSQITSSPCKTADNPDLFSHCQVGTAVGSSPVSSPIMQKSKPGQQISLMDSPFFKSTVDGSSSQIYPSMSQLSPIHRSRKLFGHAKKHKKMAKDRTSREIQATVESTSSSTETRVKLPLTKSSKKIEKKITTEKPVDFPSNDNQGTANRKDSDSDHDSDFERLVAAIPKPALKKYRKKRTF